MENDLKSEGCKSVGGGSKCKVQLIRAEAGSPSLNYLPMKSKRLGGL